MRGLGGGDRDTPQSNPLPMSSTSLSPPSKDPDASGLQHGTLLGHEERYSGCLVGGPRGDGEGDGCLVVALLMVTQGKDVHLGSNKDNHTSKVFITLLPRKARLER